MYMLDLTLERNFTYYPLQTKQNEQDEDSLQMVQIWTGKWTTLTVLKVNYIERPANSGLQQMPIMYLPKPRFKISGEFQTNTTY